MKIFQRISLFVVVALMAGLVGCETSSKSGSAGDYVDDSVITTKTKAAIFNEPTLKSTEITVVTYKGAVQLSGFVSSQTDINKAVSLARAVSGVTSVKNDMRLR